MTKPYVHYIVFLVAGEYGDLPVLGMLTSTNSYTSFSVSHADL